MKLLLISISHIISSYSASVMIYHTVNRHGIQQHENLVPHHSAYCYEFYDANITGLESRLLHV